MPAHVPYLSMTAEERVHRSNSKEPFMTDEEMAGYRTYLEAEKAEEERVRQTGTHPQAGISESAAALPASAMGVVASSWSIEIAARIPSGTSGVIRTDGDQAGHRYAREIGLTLSGRCRLLRSTSFVPREGVR